MSLLPIHFGVAEAPLYGVLHIAAEPRRRKGALILNPWGWEALRAHRTLKDLASRLAATGLDVLRFDYSGSGDSAGDQRDVSADQWVADAEYALDELQASAGIKRVSLVGLRLGGLVAMRLAELRPREIDRLVLWEPALNGAEFLEWMDREPQREDGAFPLTDRFREEVMKLSSHELERFKGHVLSVAGAAPDLHIPRARSRAEIAPGEEPPCWVEDRDHGAGAVPVPLLTRMVEWFNE